MQADGDLQHDAAESATATKCLIAHALPKAAGENLNEVAQSQTADELPKASAESSSDKAHSQTAYESPKSVAEMQKLEVADRRQRWSHLRRSQKHRSRNQFKTEKPLDFSRVERRRRSWKWPIVKHRWSHLRRSQKLRSWNQFKTESRWISRGWRGDAEAGSDRSSNTEAGTSSKQRSRWISRGWRETQKLEVADRQTPVESLEAVTEAQKLEPVQNREAVGSLEGGGETQKLDVADRQTAVESLEAVAEAEAGTVQNPGSLEGGGETIAMPRPSNLPKTVQVKFTLQKSCRFGEQFLLLGAGTSLGQWDVANAIPLEWSDGHVWITEMGLPVEEEIKFKFVRRELSGKLAWQPGPDRILRTWETTNTIIVAGEWENADDQKIKEEEPSAIPAPGEFSEERDDDVARNGEQVASGVAGGLSGEFTFGPLLAAAVVGSLTNKA
ncbi:unnamed protein product [Spirodela intermedia]|uniref:CBM20 domain-containing protein n=1 Tax=Spirodela intermedia TaxID=51605 RepID=A0A7I8IHW3_SPIIN|nr:unnamed protein product [Spirodela intermedia]CAA6656744.1 unnamed protein product [Spirodela intermedia]